MISEGILWPKNCVHRCSVTTIDSSRLSWTIRSSGVRFSENVNFMDRLFSEVYALLKSKCGEQETHVKLLILSTDMTPAALHGFSFQWYVNWVKTFGISHLVILSNQRCVARAL